ncbi:hypothetical protein KP509_28G026000 [Ceratopteris richardii]|uniref:Selenoprotein O n=1 Tax=Ceratopteris richardii TaxID=49495 RepID=A0A8T2RC71_CERRI|nr:hypothetical protein KP509_28G026000 [Ceratopteris richardii]
MGACSSYWSASSSVTLLRHSQAPIFFLRRFGHYSIHVRPPSPVTLPGASARRTRGFSFPPMRATQSQTQPPNTARIMQNESPDNQQQAQASCNGLSGEVGTPTSTVKSTLSKLEEINWDHSFVRELPGDTREGGPVRQVLHACYTKVSPSVEVTNPKLVSWSDSCAELLDLDPSEFDRADFAFLFSGATLLKGSLPYAQCYGGHQFGYWAGQLGDGRAITLGELLNTKGERWELQLKGAGKTPYSRSADGRAVLRSSIREFLCSEAMHFLRIPTTRALCLVTTGNSVVRDMFYDGNPKEEPGAVVCRVAQSFLRIGSFQIHAARTKEDLMIVQTLVDYVIHYHFPHLNRISEADEANSSTSSGKNKYLEWLIEVAERTAVLIAKWQGVGFTHGVLNTDNMSVLGLTIDYGPFGFLDAFDPKYTPNTTDLPGRRYCFANQPDIGLWNLMQLATTLKEANLISEEESEIGLNRYGERFMEEYKQLMSRKLGLKEYNRDLINKLLSNMAFDKVDYTNCFRALGNVKSSSDAVDEDLLKPIKGVLLETSKERKKAWIDWMKLYTQQVIFLVCFYCIHNLSPLIPMRLLFEGHISFPGFMMHV